MARKSVGFPEGKEWTEALLVAAVILIIGVTPTLFDAYDAWQKHPPVRPWLIGWYIFGAAVALYSWEIFAR